MSSGSAITTGPGRPLVATFHARATYSGMRRASSIRVAHLASGANIAGKSTSWNLRGPHRAVDITDEQQHRLRTCIATWTPMLALVAPGPRVTKQTPACRSSCRRRRP
ncbi:hypothetical protein DdX_22239 [Ditylenchus destructor]|uniref:Uncharacterized protein n=1 Tax=Ditylenchus destructor TaxID=166010 RepID=A0AAD4MDV7_9BILA|nr:hypothetical protein DdX_22239 [Ditylenchus destructor]